LHALVLTAAQGLLLPEIFYWDLNDATRGFSERYAPQVNGAKPCTIQVNASAPRNSLWPGGCGTP
jgi:branched-chain amino acid transport system substrate-binding protein